MPTRYAKRFDRDRDPILGTSVRGVNTEVALRAGEPTTADATAFASYEDMAAEGFFGKLFGSAAARILTEVYVRPGHDLSYERTTFADLDGRAVGMLVSFTATQHRESDDRVLRDAAGRRMIGLDIARLVGRRMFRFLDSIPGTDYYVLSLAVGDACRGQGVGRLLLDHAEQLGRDAGCSRLSLDVSVTNDVAIQLYERVGMSIEAYSPRMLFMSRLRSCRMVKPL